MKRDEQIKVSQTDLMGYPEKDLKKMAEFYDLEFTSKKDLTEKLAEIIIDNSNFNCEIFLKSLNPKDIDKKRKKIYNRFKKFKDSVYDLKSSDIKDIFLAYDEVFFNNKLSETLKKKGYGLSFALENEKTFTTEGICSYGVCNYVITMPVHKFKNFRSPSIVAGGLCYDQLTAFQKALEHEITHLIIFSLCGENSIFEYHGDYYMNMVSGLFNHTDYRHFIF